MSRDQLRPCAPVYFGSIRFRPHVTSTYQLTFFLRLPESRMVCFPDPKAHSSILPAWPDVWIGRFLLTRQVLPGFRAGMSLRE